MTDAVPRFPKGHVGRLWVILYAIDALERPTATSVAELTGLAKGGIDRYVDKIQREIGVTIVKEGAVYQIVSWGQLIRPEGVRSLSGISSLPI